MCFYLTRVINFNTKSSYSDYYSHLQSIDQIISSLKILESNLLKESKISQDTKTQVGLWASDASSNFEMYYEIVLNLKSNFIGVKIAPNND